MVAQSIPGRDRHVTRSNDSKLRNTFIHEVLVGELRPPTGIGPVRRACRFAASVAFLLVATLVPAVASAQHVQPGGADTFGWSSAVADFNADGRPDLAVARRLSNHDGSDYRIEFQLSNGRRQSVSFASPQSALRVTAVDVDNDHDLDLVVTPLLGRHVIGVWLNDGAGHFRQGRAHDDAPFTAHLAAATLNGVPPPFALATPSPRRILALPASAARAPTAHARAVRPVSPVDLPSRFLARSLAPRAPPTA